MTKFACVILLLAPAEAASLLGGTTTTTAVGQLGCSYSNRAQGVRLTVTMMDLGTSAKQTWAGLKQQAGDAKWLVGDEPGMGSTAYAQLIRRSAESSTGKCGFVAVKRTRVIQMFLTDSADKEDIAGKKETLDRFRPLAHKVMERLP
ncbi:MAG TPA: hypothetical protein VNV86_18775 [Candidatus Acidoferrum sp.]|nr:hypothetical protein [Candidatus Acidoferrum sp.]